MNGPATYCRPAVRNGVSRLKPALPFFLLLLGACYLVYLLLLPSDAIFYSGDGGLKYLMTKQFLKGDVSPALTLPSTPYLNDPGLNGMFPFDAPFVYAVGNRKVASFPLYFPLASAPFLKALGWRGLYALPAAGVFLTWVLTLLLLLAAEVGTATICTVLVSLMFASPLTLYGGMFWEHAPATFLAGIPLVLVLRKKGAHPTAASLFSLGVLSGAGVFLRPEVLVCVSSALGACLLCLGNSRIRQILCFSGGVTLATGSFLIANQLIYGHPLGLHSVQVLHEGVRLSSLIQEGASRTLKLLALFHSYWPLGLFTLAGLPLAFIGSSRRKRETLACFLVLVISIPLIALIVPNIGGKQWGPRYLLVLIPWAAVTFGLVAEAVMQYRTLWVKAPAWLLLAICLALGMELNTWQGTMNLAEDYRLRILPALRLLEAQPQQVVIVSHQYIAMELSALADTKIFLRVRNEEDISRVKTALLRQGIPSVLFVTFTSAEPPEGLGTFTELGRSRIYTVSISKMGT